jgi:hypothetical protein
MSTIKSTGNEIRKELLENKLDKMRKLSRNDLGNCR